MRRIVWQAVPSEVRADVGRRLREMAYLLPPWCRELRVVWVEDAEEGEEGVAATAEMAAGYCWVRLLIRPLYIGSTDSERERIIREELMHVLLGPLDMFVAELVDRVLEGQPDAFRSWVEGQWRERVENVADDLARIFEPRLRPVKKVASGGRISREQAGDAVSAP